MTAPEAAAPILHVNTEHGWRGGENQVALLVRGLGAQWPALTVCQPGSALARALRAAGQPVAELAMRGPLHLGAVRGLRRLLRTHGARALHAHTSHAHGLGVLACLGTAVPLIVTRRVDFAVGRSAFGRWKYGRVARFAAVSAGVRGALVAGGVAAERVAVIHDGIDFARFPVDATSPVRAEHGIPADAVVFAITAALTDHKDHRTLLTAFARVEAAAPQAWLLVVGEGELAGELATLARQLGLARTVFTGFRDDVPGILRSVDGFVLSSHLEGLGSSLMDAMHCGLPVVATRAGGIPELIDDGVDGLLVPVRDPAALAAALLRVTGDAGLRARLGAAAHQRAQARFGAETMVAAYRDLYRGLLG